MCVGFPRYRYRMQLRSLRFQDQPEKPLDRAVWWVNWVLRNPDPEHMLSPVMQLGFIRSNIYDVLAVAVAILLFVIYGMGKLISLCCCRVADSDKRTKKHKKVKTK